MRYPIHAGTWAAVAAVMIAAVISVAQPVAAPQVHSGARAVRALPVESPEIPPQGPHTTSPQQVQIKALDAQIHTLRQEFKTEADPLEAQLKGLRDKLDSDVKPLESERHELVEQSETPDLRALDADETGQMTALADREKADVEKLRQSYAAQRSALKQSFDQKRHDLLPGRK
jgi:uncharacterized phage infection (PIP) family protein YhgE